jgi:hypothetical protein
VAPLATVRPDTTPVTAGPQVTVEVGRWEDRAEEPDWAIVGGPSVATMVASGQSPCGPAQLAGELRSWMQLRAELPCLRRVLPASASLVERLLWRAQLIARYRAGQTGEGGAAAVASSAGTTLADSSGQELSGRSTGWRATKAQRSAMQRCYREAREVDPLLAISKTELLIQVSASGEVTGVLIPPLGSAFLTTCVRREVLRWRFDDVAAPVERSMSIVFGR